MVEKINSSFTRYMKDLNCEGEVVLGESPDSFDDFTLQINVSFRAEQGKQLLNQKVQSGGEKSVTTILFLVALQDLTVSPFRLVDEVNQGMDEVNERMVFSQVVRCCSEPDKPQCFLITPKLLPNLEYSPSMDIHCIFNGPYNVSSSEIPPDATAPGTLAVKRRHSQVVASPSKRFHT